jgi:hypothetical protein
MNVHVLNIPYAFGLVNPLPFDQMGIIYLIYIYSFASELEYPGLA